MSNSVGGNQQTAGAVELGGSAQAASAHPYTVGDIGFGPTWQDDEPSLREMYERACQSIVRLECEADELRAEVALLKQGMTLLAEERDTARVEVRSLNAFAESLVKTVNELKVERVELRERAKQ